MDDHRKQPALGIHQDMPCRLRPASALFTIEAPHASSLRFDRLAVYDGRGFASGRVRRAGAPTPASVHGSAARYHPGANDGRNSTPSAKARTRGADTSRGNPCAGRRTGRSRICRISTDRGRPPGLAAGTSGASRAHSRSDKSPGEAIPKCPPKGLCRNMPFSEGSSCSLSPFHTLSYRCTHTELCSQNVLREDVFS
jgi:hypothetical protein